jgi:AcrR family transcriptional regulator
MVTMRADASRNAAAILAAAREVMGERGLAAPMSEIAGRAGVAVGTLYRHHPTKQDLVAAVAADSVRQIAEEAEAALRRTADGSAPGRELADLVAWVARAYVDDRMFKQAAGSAPANTEPPAGSEAARAWQAVAKLLAQAQQAGEVRADVGVDDLAAFLAGVPDDPERLATYLSVLMSGLRS